MMVRWQTTKENTMGEAMNSTPEERAEKRVKDFTGVAWHVAVYVIINAILWIITPQAALWVTLGWGIGLAFHVAAYFIGDEGRSNRRYQKYLAEERNRDAGDAA
jgi:hypothetical protein